MTTNATTDPQTGLRYYTWQGRFVPSVTSIRRMIGMPFALHAWSVSKIVNRAVTEPAVLNAMLSRPKRPRERVLEKNRQKEAGTWLRAAATEERDLKGDRGTRVHLGVEQGTDPHFADPDVAPLLYQWRDFLAATGAKVLLSERQVFNLTYGYAGTLDLLLQIGSRVFITDLKTSRGVYLDHALQVMAYSMGEFVGANDVIDQPATDLLLGADGMAILHLSETGWEFVEVGASAELFGAFIASLTFASFLSVHDHKIDRLITQRASGAAVIPVAVGGTDNDQ